MDGFVLKLKTFKDMSRSKAERKAFLLERTSQLLSLYPTDLSSDDHFKQLPEAFDGFVQGQAKMREHSGPEQLMSRGEFQQQLKEIRSRFTDVAQHLRAQAGPDAFAAAFDADGDDAVLDHYKHVKELAGVAKQMQLWKSLSDDLAQMQDPATLDRAIFEARKEFVVHGGDLANHNSSLYGALQKLSANPTVADAFDFSHQLRWRIEKFEQSFNKFIIEAYRQDAREMASNDPIYARDETSVVLNLLHMHRWAVGADVLVDHLQHYDITLGDPAKYKPHRDYRDAASASGNNGNHFRA